MKKVIKVSAITILTIATIVLAVFAIIKEKERIDMQEAQRLNQIEQVANITEETVFETTNQDEANQLIAKIQESKKKIIKIDVRKQKSNQKKHSNCNLNYIRKLISRYKIMTKIQSLLQQLKEKSSFSYDIALGQYQLLKDTKASKQAFDDFADDLEGALRMFQ